MTRYSLLLLLLALCATALGSGLAPARLFQRVSRRPFGSSKATRSKAGSAPMGELLALKRGRRRDDREREVALHLMLVQGSEGVMLGC
mmetsp:Transcript_27796/g.74999  ORF Transcript_27796/g.74999 Transcript_27796/m.74999 type:complete len:88 (+) Transcript_27796:210-473(+)